MSHRCSHSVATSPAMPCALPLAVLLAIGAGGCACSDPGAEPDGAPASDAGAPRDASTPDAPDTEVADASAPEDASRAPDAGDPGTDGGVACEYPIAWRPDPSTRAGAEAALAIFAPTALTDWHLERGTFRSFWRVSMPVECPDGGDLWTPVTAMIDAHPEIFQIDRSEWAAPAAIPCSSISSFPTFARLDRERLGGGSVLHDFVSFAFVREEGEVRFVSFAGTYLPPLPAEVAARVAACGDLTADEARAALETASLDYTEYAACVPLGPGTYEPRPADTVELDPSSHWTWVERPELGGVLFGRERWARLIVHPDDVTASLASSDANCPAGPSGPERIIGFRLVFDAVLGTLLSSLPGVGCVVC